ncbi:MAG: response regulator transcription factor [Kiritimatiellia bacterium]
MQTRKTSVLLAEDEEAIREGLVTLFESEGYSVQTVADGEAAVEMFRRSRPDLVLLDVMMPLKNGYVVCAEIRALDPHVPIVFLSARTDDSDELRGLTVGADDYIPKTASQAVMLAHLKSVLGRTRSQEEPTGDFLFSGLCIDAARFRLVSPDGAATDLTPREIEMLRYFGRHPGEILSRDALLTRFWGLDFEGNEATLSVAIGRLREKLGPIGSRIESVYGRGYRYSP